MKFIFAAGGTGGHINPALAVASLIRQEHEDAQILFVGTKNKMEAKLVPDAGFDFKTIDISGFQRKISLENIVRNIKTILRLLKSSSQAKKIIEEFQPDVVVGFGGYVSGPVVRMAAKMKIPTAIHEQNAYPGITNKTLAKVVDQVMLTASEAEKYLEAKNPCIVTGLPVRGEMLSADRDISRAELGVSDNQKLVLSMGGSLGARTLNEAMIDIISENHENQNIYFLHAMGQYGLWVPEELEKRNVDLKNSKNIEIREYISDMHRCMSACDLIVCRAGASSLSEIEALGKASILIPSPNVAENHQFHNAMALVNNDAAMIIEEKDITKDSMVKLFNELIADDAKIDTLGKNAKAMSIVDAKERIAKVLISLVK